MQFCPHLNYKQRLSEVMFLRKKKLSEKELYIEHIKLVKVSRKYCLTACKALLCVLPEERTRLRC